MYELSINYTAKKDGCFFAVRAEMLLSRTSPNGVTPEGKWVLIPSLANPRRRQKGNPISGVQLGHIVSVRYKYGDLALSFGRSLECETVKYGYESSEIRT
jgi:hypothetical protein